MGPFRIGGPNDGEHCPFCVDRHGAHEQLIISTGVGEQSRTIGTGTFRGQGVGGEVNLASFYEVAASAYGRTPRYVGNSLSKELRGIDLAWISADSYAVSKGKESAFLGVRLS